MSVRILHEQPIDARAGGDYVHVQTCTDPNDDTVTLVTIKRVTEKPAAASPSEPTARIKTLVRDARMSPDSALGLAKCYAERKHIPVVYTET
jgi:hypothetical protein